MTNTTNNSDTAYERIRDALQSRVTIVRDNGTSISAQCPAHDDNNPSLTVGHRRDHTGAVVCCQAGCDTRDVVQALGLTVADLFDEPNLRQTYAPRRSYQYPGGRQVHRKPNKEFPQSGNKADRSLYGSDHITDDTTTVYVVEGEKDVEAVQAAGGVAVCSAMGAGKAARADWSPLKDKTVVIVGDNDEPGRAHNADVYRLIKPLAAAVSFAKVKTGKDFADHYAADYGLADLIPVDPPEQIDDNGQGDDDGRPRIYKATDLQPAKQPEWIGRGRLPRAATTILIGDEGIGKSLAWVMIAAAITTGRACEAFGIPAREPGVVVIVVTEDDWSTTVLPRLIVAGADLEHIRVICDDDDGSGAPTFPHHMSVLDDLDTDPALVVVDAWLDTVPAGLSVKDTQSARQALHPWKEFATRTRAAVLLLTHTNRVSTGNSRDKYGATIALRQKARMTLYAQRDNETGNLLIGPDKANSAAAVPAAEFIIESVTHFEPTIDDDGTVGRLKYVGQSDKTAAEHLADKHEEQADGEPRSAGQFARDWIKEYLSEEGPNADGQAAKKAANKVGIKERTLQRACQAVGVVYTPTGVGKDYRVNWSLPDQINNTDNTAQQTSAPDGDTPAKPRANGSAQLGASGASGVSPGQEPTPTRAKEESGASMAQVRDQREQVPAPARQPKEHAPVGAPTAHTPGMTARVQQTLAKGNGKPICPTCNRAPARADTGECDLCTVNTNAVKSVHDDLVELGWLPAKPFDVVSPNGPAK